MDPLSHLLLLHNPQGRIDKNCVLSGEWQLPHRAGQLRSVRSVVQSCWICQAQRK